MGVLTHELLAPDGTDTAMEWLKKGCLEKRLQELADRIDAGEKIGMVSHLVYRNKDDYTGKFNLKQVYDEIKSDVGFAKELLKTISENQKKAKAFARATMTELGLTYDDDLDLDLGDDDDLKSDDGFSLFEPPEDKEDNEEDFDLSDPVPPEDKEDNEEDFDLSDPLPTEAQMKERKESFVKLNPTLDEMKSQINKVEESIRKHGPYYCVTVKDGSLWQLKYLLQIAKEAYAEATENSSEKKNDVSGADKTEENDNADNLEKELEKIKKLFEKGLIDESDYKAKKNKLLGI